MNKEEVISFLNKVGIDTTGKFTKDRYLLPIQDSDEYSRYYTILDQYDGLELSDTSSMTMEVAAALTYTNDKYKVRLNANFTDDYYNLTVEEIK